MDKIIRAHYDSFLPWSMPTKLQFTHLIGQATSLANAQMRFRHTLAPPWLIGYLLDPYYPARSANGGLAA